MNEVIGWRRVRQTDKDMNEMLGMDQRLIKEINFLRQHFKIPALSVAVGFGFGPRNQGRAQ
jgi:hypothetical protein